MSIGTVDDFVDMNGSGSIGETLTTAILSSGTIGPNTTWILSPPTPTGLTIGAHHFNRRDSVTVTPTSYPPSHTSRSIALDNSVAFVVAQQQFGATFTAGTVAGLITFGVAEGIGNLWDLVRMDDDLGNGTNIIQLSNGAGAAYVVRIETVGSLGTLHSPDITIVQGNTYWITMKGNYTAGLAQIAVYGPVNSGIWTQVGVTGSVAMGTGGKLNQVQYGNAEAGTSTGTTFFENWLTDFTTAAFPLGPGNASGGHLLSSLGAGG